MTCLRRNHVHVFFGRDPFSGLGSSVARLGESTAAAGLSTRESDEWRSRQVSQYCAIRLHVCPHPVVLQRMDAEGQFLHEVVPLALPRKYLEQPFGELLQSRLPSEQAKHKLRLS